VAGRVSLVGVFVNLPPTTVDTIASEVGLDLLQFHGDETPAALAPFAERAIKVLRLEAPPEADLLDGWPGMWGYLIEGRHAALYGGTGEGWAYEMIGNLPRQSPLFVAGGLTPENVRDAVRQSRAWGVDVCSGVEASPGVKDKRLLQMFFNEVKHGEG
jgi:phosphoribosylanthranilate isomerase